MGVLTVAGLIRGDGVKESLVSISLSALFCMGLRAPGLLLCLAGQFVCLLWLGYRGLRNLIWIPVSFGGDYWMVNIYPIVCLVRLGFSC